MHDKLVYDISTLCQICNEELDKEKVRDNFHVSGKIWGAAHEVGNLKYKVPKFFPVVFHKLAGCDSHHFIKKKLGNSDGYIYCIPNNEENYTSLTKQVIVDKFVNMERKEVSVKRKLRFIDSLRYIAFIINSPVKVLEMKTTSMLKQFRRNSILCEWRITTTFTICLMYYY